MKKIMLSGLRVSGNAHIGNYFGAMKQFVDLQNSGYEVFAMVANLHTLNTVLDAKTLKQNTIDLIKDYLAIGLDPNKVTLFLQSDIQEHTELTWLFDCLVSVSLMERSHAYKDSVANGRDPNMGLFNYPVLMAADILLYSPDIVPVGKDQEQHVEYARDIASKFNFAFNNKNENGDVLDPTFKLPEAVIKEEVSLVPGLDGRKMSKSYGNHIPLFASDEEIRKLCMGIVTDSAGVAEKKNADTNNIFNIYKLFASADEVKLFREKLENGGVGYGDLKRELAERIISFISPMRNRRESISDEEAFLVMKEGAQKAKEVAKEKMKEVREKAGIIYNL